MDFAVDAFADPGCFLDARPFLTDAFMTGDPDARLEAYLDFLAAAVIAGDVRQYGTSALRTPRGLQVLTGACADVADIAAIRATHPVIAAGFGEYVRRLGAAMPCGGSGEPLTPLRIASEIQGHPYVDGQEMPAGVNAWLWLEYDFIFLAMGWHDGVSATRRGHPRPPLCHYGTMP